MPRVLQVFEPPDGGVPEAVVQLAEGLGEHGIATEVAGPPGTEAARRLSARGIRVHELPLTRTYDRPDRDARALAALGRLVRSGGYDVVHAHAAKAGVLGRLAARAGRARSVYSPQCLPFVGDVSRRRRTVAVGIERALAPLTSAMVCAAEAERELALAHRLLPPERLAVVRNAAPEIPAEGPVDERLVRLRGEGTLAAAVCVLRRQKGLDDLLRATPRVLAERPEARIAIVGDGPERPALEAQAAALGLDREPRFALLPYEGPPARHLRALDVFVLPSLWEALPLGALEALACGVPQVVTDVGGTAEAVTAETGRIVAPRDPEALGEALAGLLGDADERARMGAASRRRHAEAFTVDRMVAGTVEVYAHALDSASFGRNGGP
jgi:glycosyltransferase involved in cell wall biosynthesis